MPPAAIASSVVGDHLERLGRRVAHVARGSRKSSVIACGNFGARPKPPKRGSNCARDVRDRASSRIVGGERAPRPPPAPSDVLCSIAAVQLARPARATSSRWSRHASATASHDAARTPGMPWRSSLREVRAAVERPAVGREEHRHRPAAAAGQRLHRLHVDRVDVGPFLAVDLHVHEEVGSSPRRRRRPRTTRAPSRGTSGTTSSRPTGRSACPRRGPARTPRRPTGTSRPGCRRAGGGTGWSRRARRFTCTQATASRSARRAAVALAQR